MSNILIESRENEVFDVCSPVCPDATKVLVIYTGGTIGMLKDETGALAPVPGVLAQKLRLLTQLHDAKYADKIFHGDIAKSTLVLPDLECHGKRIIYKIHEWENLIDSADITLDDWTKIVEDIQNNYNNFDGFVILHGTDTMAYTASALSFMLENLGKTVVITGSQIPIFQPRSDGADNFASALIIAGTKNIPEVTLFFGCNLFRGNRTSKVSSDDFDAFASRNFEPLAIAGLKLKVNHRAVIKKSGMDPFHAHTVLNRNVVLLTIFPSITHAAVRAFLQPPIEGVVLQTYGAGNIPSNREDIHNELKAAVARGVVIVNITQCSRGSVHSLYKTGQCLSDSGVISGYDMTPEAALAKLSYVLSKDWDYETRCMMMETNLRGELTGCDIISNKSLSVIDAVSRCVGVTDSLRSEGTDICASGVMLSLLEYANTKARSEFVDSQKEFETDLYSPCPEERSALHIAACLGSLPVLQVLLQQGADINSKDRNGNTPLMYAVHFNHKNAVNMLLERGGVLPESEGVHVGAELRAAAAAGDTRRLALYKSAGAFLATIDSTGRSPLHLAALLGQAGTVRYLMEEGLSPVQQDKMGFTPIDYAERGGYINTVNVLKSQNDKLMR